MAEGSFFAAMGTLVPGLVLLFSGLGLLPAERLDSAGRADIVAGCVLSSYAALALLVARGEYWFFSPYFYLFFVVGFLLFRQYYLVVSPADRRQRDAINAAIVGVPGAAAMVGLLVSTDAMFGLFLTAIPATLAGCGLLLRDAVRAVRGETVHVRDVAAALLSLLLGPMWLFLALTAIIPGQ